VIFYPTTAVFCQIFCIYKEQTSSICFPKSVAFPCFYFKQL